jgi:glycosyltransferase involved in cell wall biosynthesis
VTRELTVTVLEGHDFGRWSEEHRGGSRPSALPYGLEDLRVRGLRLRHADATHSDRALARMLRRKDPDLPYELRFNGALGQVLLSLPQLLGSDLCLSVFEHHAGVYARLVARARAVLPPLVLMSCYIAQWLTEGPEPLRRLAIRIAGAAQAITVFSSNQVEIIRARTGVAEELIHVVPYGIDTDFYVPPESTGSGRRAGFVAAIGKDEGRDWRTFLAAAALTPEIPYKLATAKWMLTGLTLPANVQFLGQVEHQEYRGLLRDAAVVVIPTKPYAYPTGQSVLLEAMASGAPVVVPATPAMSDYTTEAAGTYAVGDPRDLATVVTELWDDPQRREAMSEAARREARNRFDTANMWEAIAPVLKSAAEREAKRPGLCN